MSRDKIPPSPARATLDFGGIPLATPKPAPAAATPENSAARPAEDTVRDEGRPNSTPAAIAGLQAGFTSRDPGGHIDGRTLKAKGRTKQLNVRVTPELHQQLVLGSQRFDSVASYLEYLISLDDNDRA